MMSGSFPVGAIGYFHWSNSSFAFFYFQSFLLINFFLFILLFFVPIITVQASWNIMAQAQKPDFVFRRNRRVHLNRRGASVQSTTGSRGVRISGSNAGYTMFRGSVKSTGYTFHSPVSPSLSLPCITVCYHILPFTLFIHRLRWQSYWTIAIKLAGK